MRPHPLNPRLSAAPALQAKPVSLPHGPVGVLVKALPVVEDDSEDVKAARAGGFHESSYELQHGLQVSESEWPDDVTVPAALGER